LAHYRLDLEYDGSDFLGWQVQPEGRTVQGVVEAALGRILRETVRVTAAGRTDRGVHASGQVAHCAGRLQLEPRDLTRALAGQLPADVRLRRLRRVAPDFHARYGARCRHYIYLVSGRPSTFARRYSGIVEGTLDLAAMQGAARAIQGTHDFRPFAVRGDQETTGICQVSDARWDRWRDGARFSVTADRFLMRMVRMLVGAMIEVGRGRLPASAVAEALDAPVPARRPPAAPAAGLYLAGVGYPSAASWRIHS